MTTLTTPLSELDRKSRCGWAREALENCGEHSSHVDARQARTILRYEQTLANLEAENDDLRGQVVDLHQDIEHLRTEVTDHSCADYITRFYKLKRDINDLLLGSSTSWPIDGLLERLADGVNHLLTDHDCDAQGHESLRYAERTARQRIEAVRNHGDNLL